MKPPSPKSKAPLKSLDIDEALIERVMGKPKDAKKASDNLYYNRKFEHDPVREHVEATQQTNHGETMARGGEGVQDR